MDDHFNTAHVQVGSDSVDEKTSSVASARTVDKVTENIKAIIWKAWSKKWNHLKNAKFTRPI